MRSDDSFFIHTLQHQRPDACRRVAARSFGLPGDTWLVERVPQRPARFRIGLDPEWDHPPIQRRLKKDAPFRRSFYIGKVTDVQGSSFAAELYEVPSGRASVAGLDRASVIKGLGRHREAAVGDHVKVWAWEVATGPEEVRVAVEVRRPQLTRAAKAKIRALLAVESPE